jgi:2-oxo-4-hydroxy-4-carboxy-5-ureidoimidazoline decarboxylase
VPGPDAPPGLDEDTLRRLLPECLAVPRWVDDVVRGAPYPSFEDLEVRASGAAMRFTDEELEQALSHHPRIGERPTGDGQAQQFSRSEQSAADAEDAKLKAAIADGNRRYEERFDRVFLIRAAGRSRRQILDELDRRLRLDDASERATVVSELHDITLLRIRSLWRNAT